jgi:superfamily II DNA or RNA helicase
VHKYILNASKPIEFGKTKKWFSTDYKECARLSRKIIFSSGEQKMFASLNRMRFINSCDSLTTAVNNWINQNKDKRFLLFTGDENVGKKYDIPMFNSKSKNDDVLKDFQNGTINQLCLIKKGSAGITYPNLQHVLITAINSNGENLEQMLGRSLLQDTENAEIHIFVSTEDFQNKWLNSSLESINKSKIKYINI